MIKKETTKSIYTDAEREIDVLKLITGVLETEAIYRNNSHTADEVFCPFCYGEQPLLIQDMNKINHESYCPYLIAKDLSTGLINKINKNE